MWPRQGPGAASVSDMFPAILDAKVDGWAQTDAVDSGEPTTPGGGGKQAADLAKTAELAVEYAKETEVRPPGRSASALSFRDKTKSGAYRGAFNTKDNGEYAIYFRHKIQALDSIKAQMIQ